MAKKGNRQIFTFQCSVCKNKNYVSVKNVLNTKDKMAMSKYCENCKKHTEHQEIKISK